ncbi:MAG: Alpha/beta fold hydrolase, partial [Acidobacteriota bacterium]|nr:Alpha/beta fold hydrolase [Acidobacteriota bacterium]
MYQRKQIILMVLLVAALSFAFNGEMRAENYHHGQDVDAIYQNIRNSGPVYEWDETILSFENEGMTVVCSLTIPRTPQLVPIVITLNGFTGDRNDLNVPGTDEPFFRRIARIMAEQGIATLRVDFRGSGDSDGEYQITTFSTQISDAIAAVNYIDRNLKHKVKSNSIGILGFSQGGLVGSCTAARDKRVDSLALWSVPAFAPHDYEGLITREGIQAGLALPDGGWDMFGLYVLGQFIYEVPLGKGFFQDLFKIDPLTELKNCDIPMMYVSGSQDIIVWPQPIIGETFIKYHKGDEKLVV